MSTMTLDVDDDPSSAYAYTHNSIEGKPHQPSSLLLASNFSLEPKRPKGYSNNDNTMR